MPNMISELCRVNNGYAGAGYTIGADGTPEIYRYAGFAAQATTNVMATVTLRL